MERPRPSPVPVHDLGERVDPLFVHEDVELHQVVLPVPEQIVVEGAVPLGDGLESVVEVVEDLRQRHVEDDLHAARRGVVEPRILPPPIEAVLHDRPHVPLGDQDARSDIRLQRLLDLAGVRVVEGVVDAHLLPVGELEVVLHRRHRQDDRLAVLPLEPLLHDLQVEEPQESAAEPEAQGRRGIALIGQGGVVQLVLLQRVRERPEVLRRHRVE